MQRAFGSPCLGRHKLGVQRVGEPRYNFVLHVKKVGDGLVKALRPNVIAGFGVDQLHVDAEAVAATLHRAFEHIADVQLTSQLLYVNPFSLEGERGVTCNYERATDARQVRGQALGHTIHEVFLLGIAADVREGQNDHGQSGSGRWRPSNSVSVLLEANRIGPGGTADVLQIVLAEVGELDVDLPMNLFVSG